MQIPERHGQEKRCMLSTEIFNDLCGKDKAICKQSNNKLKIIIIQTFTNNDLQFYTFQKMNILSNNMHWKIKDQKNGANFLFMMLI